MTFALKARPQRPPIHETMEQVMSPPMRLALSNAVNVIAGMICADPMWEQIQTAKLEGRDTGDIAAMVKARAFDIIMEHSGDISGGESQTSMAAAYLLTAAHHAVERVIFDARRLGIIL